MSIFDRVKQAGWHGIIGLGVVCALIFIAVYGFVFRPDHELTARAADVLFVGTGGVITAAVMMLRGGGGQPPS